MDIKYTYYIVIAVALFFLQGETIASKGKRPDLTKFIPAGYVIFDTVYGDIDKDGFEDCVIIIKGTDKKNIITDESRGELDRNRRGILILLNKNAQYELAVKNYDCFSSENEDGGVYFPPELSINIRKGNLYVHYAHGRYGYWEYTFRYRDSDLELIGFDIGEARGPITISQTSINYVTKKKVIETNIDPNAEDDAKEVFKKTVTRIKASKLLRLSTIKDFDELDLDE